MPDSVLASWQTRIREAAGTAKPLRIRGGGTKDFYGEKPRGDVLDTRAYAGIVDYDPTELVITVRAGTPLAHVEQVMRESGQMLAFEPPRFGEAATLGGAVASGLSGPRRPYAGAVRDFVLGVRILDGTGEDLSFGGRVMKNVAGFDVSRLMTGALGTLGIITEVSLKCLPLPRVEASTVFECAADAAVGRMNEWGSQSLPLSATCHSGGRLWVRFSGAAPAVEAALARVGGDRTSQGDAPWEAFREQTHPFFSAARDGGASLWRLSVKSTAPPGDLGGEQLIEWGGALRWLVTPERSRAERIREWAQGNGGHATLFRAADKSPGVFHPLAPPMLLLHQRLKKNFDPQGILNPGRLHPAF